MHLKGGEDMANMSKLKGLIVERGNTQENVAKEIGIDRSTFYRKVREGGHRFTVSEVNKIVKSVPLTAEEALDIFFSKQGA